MKNYLCKFIPPRVNFLNTLSEEEMRLMKEHGAFLDRLLEAGIVVAHGPVIEGNNGYGVSLYRIEDDADISQYTSEDPIVKSGIGHYEHYFMPHLSYRL